MFLQPKAQTQLELALDRAFTQLDSVQFGSQDYDDILEIITKLQKLQNEKDADSVSKDTILTVGANLLGILLIISTEREHVITTKALSMLQKSKNT